MSLGAFHPHSPPTRVSGHSALAPAKRHHNKAIYYCAGRQGQVARLIDDGSGGPSQRAHRINQVVTLRTMPLSCVYCCRRCRTEATWLWCDDDALRTVSTHTNLRQGNLQTAVQSLLAGYLSTCMQEMAWEYGQKKLGAPLLTKLLEGEHLCGWTTTT